MIEKIIGFEYRLVDLGEGEKLYHYEQCSLTPLTACRLVLLFTVTQLILLFSNFLQVIGKFF